MRLSKVKLVLVAVVIASLIIGLGLTMTQAKENELKGKVAVILDVGGRGDLSFNDMGFKGTDKAAQDFGLEMTTIQSSDASDYLPNVRAAARSGKYDLIICVGFLLTDALKTVAPEFPQQKFMIIDSVVKEPNVMSIIFKENEGSALVGALSAMVAAHYGYDKVGMVLGIEIPVLYHFEAGYRFGIYWGNKKYAQVTGTNPGVKLLYKYTGTFSDIAKGYKTTNAFLEQGAGLVYNVAGPLGIGDLKAITEYLGQKGKEAGPPFMIGVDANQDWMGDGHRVLASMMKRVDVGCYSAVEAVVNGTFEGGIVSMGLASKGVALSRYQDLLDFAQFGIKAGQITVEQEEKIVENWLEMRDEIPYWIWDAVSELEGKIIAGQVKVPTANTGKQMKTIRNRYP